MAKGESEVGGGAAGITIGKSQKKCEILLKS